MIDDEAMQERVANVNVVLDERLSLVQIRRNLDREDTLYQEQFTQLTEQIRALERLYPEQETEMVEYAINNFLDPSGDIVDQHRVGFNEQEAEEDAQDMSIQELTRIIGLMKDGDIPLIKKVIALKLRGFENAGTAIMVEEGRRGSFYGLWDLSTYEELYGAIIRIELVLEVYNRVLEERSG